MIVQKITKPYKLSKVFFKNANHVLDLNLSPDALCVRSSVMEEFTKSLPRLSRTKGTKAYNFRNYLALVVIGCGLISGFTFYFTEEVQTFSTDPKSPTSTNFDKTGKLSNETKKESIAETDDSFDIFVPLKIKNYKNGLKKPNNASSTNKFKKKKVTSSNRICPYFSTRRPPTSSKEDRDLKLAIARSLEDISPSKSSDNVLNDIVNVKIPSDTVNEKKLIRQNSNFLKSLTNKTKKPGTNTLLFRRTGEERKEIIIKKIGILLIEKENFHDQCLEKLEINFISSHLEEAWDKNCTLWELSKIEVNNLDEFYVSTLEKFIDRPPVTSEQPITAMSDAETVENSCGECV